MKIEIKLDHPDYCYGCPMLMIFPEYTRCYYFNEGIVENISNETENVSNETENANDVTWDFVRPERCKEENGL